MQHASEGLGRRLPKAGREAGTQNIYQGSSDKTGPIKIPMEKLRCYGKGVKSATRDGGISSSLSSSFIIKY